MNYSELLQLVKGWSNLVSNRIIIWRLQIIDKDLLILSDKLRRLTPSQVRTVEAIIDECNNLFNQKEITLLSQKR